MGLGFAHSAQREQGAHEHTAGATPRLARDTQDPPLPILFAIASIDFYSRPFLLLEDCMLYSFPLLGEQDS